MQSFTNIIYDEEPQKINILGKSVDVVTSKKQVQLTDDEGNTLTKWEANIERYESIEFARKAIAEDSDYALAGKILLGMEE